MMDIADFTAREIAEDAARSNSHGVHLAGGAPFRALALIEALALRVAELEDRSTVGKEEAGKNGS